MLFTLLLKIFIFSQNVQMFTKAELLNKNVFFF